MRILQRISDIRTLLKSESYAGNSLGFVPTMGSLHNGHASLVQSAVNQCDKTVVSIFVNPTQFGPGEDFELYPRDMDVDGKLLETLGVDYIFAPEVSEIYGDNKGEISFKLRNFSKILCGGKRPGHLEGVIQVVAKLFNIIQPDRAYFGEKDFQQLALIKILARELFLDLEVVGCPIIREKDGLAMSSRNVYLSQEERKQALFLNHALNYLKENIKSGDSVKQCYAGLSKLQAEYPLVKLDYFEIRNAKNLTEIDTISAENNPHAFVAAFLGKTRLIDNSTLLV